MVQFKTNHRKILECILWFAVKKPQIEQYALLKLLFLADKLHLNKYGRPASGDNYVAMEYGPVPTFAYDVLKKKSTALTSLKLTDFPFRIESNQQNKAVVVVPERGPDIKLFSKSDISAFTESLAKYGDWKFGRLMDFTHADPAYKTAWESKGASNAPPIDYALLLTHDHATEEAREELSYIARYGMS